MNVAVSKYYRIADVERELKDEKLSDEKRLELEKEKKELEKELIVESV